MSRVLIVTMISSVLSIPAAGINPEEKVRPAAVVGAFYPADPGELGKMIDEFLAEAKPPQVKNLVALISPHAGYIYSGRVAAYSYALLKGRKVERVVVIAPSHYEAFDFASVYEGAAYATPLGQIPVDHDFAARLAALNPQIRISDRGHTLVDGHAEHALEDQLPFLQRVLGPFKLVPIVMGQQDYDLCRALGVSLAKLIRGPETLIVASSDLSHFHPYDEAVAIDHRTLKAIEEWDYLSMARNFERRVWEACGGGPIVAAMIAAERLGANQATVLKYANSGDVIADRSRVVGYGAVALSKSPAQASVEQSFSLSAQEKERLLQIAKKSVETAVKEGKLYECSAAGLEALIEERGAFVRLTKNGQLRGCIGYVAAMKPLCHTVRDVAALAATRDQRFPPISARELDSRDRESIWRQLKALGTRVRLITVQHEPCNSSGTTIALQTPELGDEQVSEIIQQHGIAKEAADRFAPYCGGSPRVADVVGWNLQNNPDDLMRPLDTSNVWNRFVEGADPPSSELVTQRKLVLSYLALFVRYGYGPPYEHEAKAIAEQIAKASPAVNWARFQEIVHSLRQRRILQRARLRSI